MSFCEDYPACGHGPPPLGDGGGCPDENGCYECVLCHRTMPKGWHSAICRECRTNPPRDPDTGEFFTHARDEEDY